MVTLSPEAVKILPILKALPTEEKMQIIHLLSDSETSENKQRTDSIIGFTQGDIQILDDIVSPTTDDSDWKAMQ